MADESLLTGESVPVRKRVGDADAAPARPGGDDLPFVYCGTLLTQGQGVARVIATGVRTEIGKIGKALQTLVPELSSIQRETRRAVLIFAVIGLALCVLVTVLYGLHAWRLAERPARRNHAGDGESAGGISGRAHGIPGARRMADFATRRPDPARRRRSRRWDPRRCCASTRPARSLRTAWPCRRLWVPGKELDLQDAADAVPVGTR